jgi:hypothetical protein
LQRTVDFFLEKGYQKTSDITPNMKIYKVEITETLQATVEIEANSPEEAEEIVETQWKDGAFVLGADNFTDVQFSALQPEHSNETVESEEQNEDDMEV